MCLLTGEVPDSKMFLSLRRLVVDDCGGARM